jgi:UDP-2,3-diacylglucosamine hydrolase
MGKKLLFLGDVHLAPWHPRRAELFFGFLARHRAEAECVYILGDLLDFWVGPRQRDRPEWGGLLERLGGLVADGPPVRVIGGNRDYLLDRPSLEPYGLESLGMDHRFEHDGLRITLVHGHMRFPNSWFAGLFLRFIQSRLMRSVAHAAPVSWCLFVAESLRRYRRWVNRRTTREDSRRYDPAAFAPLFDEGADVVVCGHNHWAKDYTEQLARPGCRLFAVGEWLDAPSWLEYADGEFTLHDPHIES